MPIHKEPYSLIWAWLILAVAVGILTGLGWRVFTKPPRRLFPPQRFRATPWSGRELAVALFLVLFLVPFFDSLILRLLRVPESWFPIITGVSQIAALVWLFRAVSGTRWHHLGLSGHRLAADAFAGYWVWLLLAPLVYAVNFPVTLVYNLLHSGPPEQHPLLKSLQGQPSPLDWVAVFVAAVVVAPLYEELLFRGVLQPWLARRRWGGYAAMVGAFCLALNAGIPKIEQAFSSGNESRRWEELFTGLAPVLFVLAMIPGYRLADRIIGRWLPYPGAGRTIYGVALLFAAAHSSVWPSPIPLFVLGLGLGCLAYRTQSLTGSIVVHTLFNGMTVLSALFVHGGLESGPP